MYKFSLQSFIFVTGFGNYNIDNHQAKMSKLVSSFAKKTKNIIRISMMMMMIHKYQKLVTNKNILKQLVFFDGYCCLGLG